MRAVVPIEHEGVRGRVAVGIIAETIDRRVPDQLHVLIIAAVTGAARTDHLIGGDLPRCLGGLR
jgi:hypothetical protein